MISFLKNYIFIFYNFCWFLCYFIKGFFCYPDPDQRFRKWIRIWPNDTDPTGSETLIVQQQTILNQDALSTIIFYKRIHLTENIFTWNFLWQIGHSYGQRCSGLCERRCFFMEPFEDKCFPHSLHLAVSLGLCILCRCTTRLRCFWKTAGHFWQWCSPSSSLTATRDSALFSPVNVNALWMCFLIPLTAAVGFGFSSGLISLPRYTILEESPP